MACPPKPLPAPQKSPICPSRPQAPSLPPRYPFTYLAPLRPTLLAFGGLWAPPSPAEAWGGICCGGGKSGSREPRRAGTPGFSGPAQSEPACPWPDFLHRGGPFPPQKNPKKIQGIPETPLDLSCELGEPRPRRHSRKNSPSPGPPTLGCRQAAPQPGCLCWASLWGVGGKGDPCTPPQPASPIPQPPLSHLLPPPWLLRAPQSHTGPPPKAPPTWPVPPTPDQCPP